MLSCTRPTDLLLPLLLLLLGSAVVLAQEEIAYSGPRGSGNCTKSWKINCPCKGNETLSVVDVEEKSVSRKASIGFVIDTTASMSAEISVIKEAIRDVVSAGKKSVDKFVIGQFGDDKSSVRVTVSSNADELHNLLKRVRAVGGLDCPESALHGIRAVAQAVSKDSIVYLFTDASAKDGELEAGVTQLLLDKNIRLHVLATGGLCDLRTDEIRRMAAATNGTVLMTDGSKRLVTSAALNYMRKFLKYGVRFLRAMPESLKEINSIATGDCSRCNVTETTVCHNRETRWQSVMVPAPMQSGSVAVVAVLLALLLLLLLLLLWKILNSCCGKDEERQPLTQ